MSKNPGLLTIWAAALLVFSGVAGCGEGGDSANKVAVTSVIQNKGSDTMVNIAQAWAEAYKKAEPSVEVEVSGGGSGVGIAALSKGAVDIANSSRNMKTKESDDAKRNTGKEPKEFIVGYDALAIIVHKDNPVEELTMEQIASIYQENSTVTKWSDLGITLPSGRDRIIRLSRQSSSGTYEFLREKVLKNKDFGLGSLDLNGSKEVVELVANTYGAIGYSGMGYTTKGVKMIRVSPKAGAPGILPTLETAKDKTYPISRSLQLYTLGEPQGAVRKYIDWIMSDAGQSIVEQSGFVSIPANLRTK